MIVRYTEKKVTLGNTSYTVITPMDIDNFVNLEYVMDADRKAFQALAFSLIKLITVKNLIIWFPLWKNSPAKYMYDNLERIESRNENFDVLLLSHTLQFPLHDWKVLRRKLNKTKGKYHKEKFDFNWACKKSEQLSENFKQKKYSCKKADLLHYSFRFDTHIFVGGIKSFTDFFLICVNFLKQHSEDYFRSGPDMDWAFLPQDKKSVRFYRDPIEIGFWDRRYEKKHQYIWENSDNLE